MKRFVLLGFIIFVVPVWMVSCHKDDCSVFVRDWTFSELKINMTDKVDGSTLINNATISTDSVYFRCHVLYQILSSNYKKENSKYALFACPPSTDIQHNSISNVIFGFFKGNKIDSSMSSSLNLVLKNYEEFDWSFEKKKFIDLMSMYSLTHDEIIVLGKFLNPHSSKSVQIIMLAIKENGDTLKALSQEIVLK